MSIYLPVTSIITALFGLCLICGRMILIKLDSPEPVVPVTKICCNSRLLIIRSLAITISDARFCCF